MRLDVFTKIIESINSTNDDMLKLYTLGVDLINISNKYDEIITLLLSSYYGEEGTDIIYWYCFEKFEADTPLQMLNNSGDEICTDIESLWNYVELLRTSSDFKEYELKSPISEIEMNSILHMMFH